MLRKPVVFTPASPSRIEEDAWSFEAQVEALLAEVPVGGGYSAEPKQRIYVDTSVIGGCFDAGFREPSRRLFDMFSRGDLIFVYSDVVVRELQGAPQQVRGMLRSVPDEHAELLGPLPLAEHLAAEYVRQGALPKKSHNDAAHIAYATVAGVDRLVSWNCKHMVNPDRIPALRRISLEAGCRLIEMSTPLAMGDEFDDEGGKGLRLREVCAGGSRSGRGGNGWNVGRGAFGVDAEPRLFGRPDPARSAPAGPSSSRAAGTRTT